MVRFLFGLILLVASPVGAQTVIDSFGDPSMNGQAVTPASVAVATNAVQAGTVFTSSGSGVFISTTGTDAHDVFRVKNNADSVLMAVQQDGKVGVGTASPGYKQEIAGTAAAANLGLQGSQKFRGAGAWDAAGTWQIGERAFLGGTADFSIYDVAGAKEVITLDQGTGNVGIRTASPCSTCTLHVPYNAAFGAFVDVSSMAVRGSFDVSGGTLTVSGAGAWINSTSAQAGDLKVGTPADGQGQYVQLDSGGGAPVSTDCDNDSEVGRMFVNTATETLYICNGATRGWDTVALTD